MRRHFTREPILASNSSVNADVFKLDTDTSYYNNFLNEKDLAYMQKSKNRTGRIVYMTPEAYYRECAYNIFEGTTVEELKKQRRSNSQFITQYIHDMLSGDQFPLCYLNYADKGQEGLHRMMAAGEAFGWDVKFPVLVVSAVDGRVEKLHRIWRYWNDAVYDAERVRYDRDTWEEELVKEVEYNLEYSCGKHYDVVIVDRRDLDECKKYDLSYAIEIAIAEFKDIMHPSTVFEPKFKEVTEEHSDEDIDLDDIDFEDLEDDLFIW